MGNIFGVINLLSQAKKPGMNDVEEWLRCRAVYINASEVGLEPEELDRPIEDGGLKLFETFKENTDPNSATISYILKGIKHNVAVSTVSDDDITSLNDNENNAYPHKVYTTSGRLVYLAS